MATEKDKVEMEYKDIEKVTCLVFKKKDGTWSKVARGRTLDGKTGLTVQERAPGCYEVTITAITPKKK